VRCGFAVSSNARHAPFIGAHTADCGWNDVSSVLTADAHQRLVRGLDDVEAVMNELVVKKR
jgi:hypothetical protein